MYSACGVFSVCVVCVVCQLVTFGLRTLSVLVLSRQMPSSTPSSVEKSLLIWSLWQLPSFSAPLSVQLSVWGDF